MKKTTTGAIIAAFGVVALSGGATFALWNQSTTVTAGTITNGDIAITTTGAPSWFDTSADVPGNPSTINPTTFPYSDGDTVMMRQPLSVSLTGDHIDADLVVGDETLALTNGSGVTGAYSILDNTGAALPGESSLPLGGPSTIHIHQSGSYTLEVDLTFRRDPANGLATSIQLPAISLRLQQVRPEEG